MCLIDVVACGWGEGVAEVLLDSRSTRAGMAFPEQYGGVEIDRRSVLTISTNGQFSQLKLDLWSLYSVQSYISVVYSSKKIL